jgi:hypothetical protein
MMPAGVLEALEECGKTEAEEYGLCHCCLWYRWIHRLDSLKLLPRIYLATLNRIVRFEWQNCKRNGVCTGRNYWRCCLQSAGCQIVPPDHAEGPSTLLLTSMYSLNSTSPIGSIKIRIGLLRFLYPAGVLGDLNPHWCIVGDTVSTASRMESYIQANVCIHMSETTFKLVKNSGFKLSDPDVIDCQGRVKWHWVYD